MRIESSTVSTEHTGCCLVYVCLMKPNKQTQENENTPYREEQRTTDTIRTRRITGFRV